MTWRIRHFLRLPLRNPSLLDRIFGATITILAVIVRWTPAFQQRHVNLVGDMVHYDYAARIMIQYHMFAYWGLYPSAQVTPGYPLFLALCYELSASTVYGDYGRLLFTILVQAVLSGLTIGLLYMIARRLLGVFWSLVTAAMWTFYGPSIVASRLILTETLYVFLLLLFVWRFLVAMERRSVLSWGGAGAILAMTTLVRPTVFPLLLAGLAYLVVHWRRGEEISFLWRLYAFYLGAFVIFMSPWWIRNVMTFHQLILTSTDAGNPLLYGTDPHFTTDVLGSGLSGSQQEGLALHRIAMDFSVHPWRYLKWYTIDKLQLLFAKPWLTNPVGVFGTSLSWHLFDVGIGAVGAVFGVTRRQGVFIFGTGFLLVLLQLPFIPLNRYVFPVMPFLMIGVGVMADTFTRTVLQRLRGSVHI